MRDLKYPPKFGSGITRRDGKRAFIGDLYIVEFPAGDERSAFDGRIWQAENWASKALIEAIEVPPDVPEEGLWEFARKEAMALVQKILRGETGYRPYEHAEWYAAEILSRASRVRRELVAGKPPEAAAGALSLGLLVREAEMKFAFESAALAHARSLAGASKGGSRRRPRLHVVDIFIRGRLKRAVKGEEPSVRDLWDLIPCNEDDCLWINRSKLFIDMQQLCVAEKRGKNWERVGDISFRTFRRYVTRARAAR